MTQPAAANGRLAAFGDELIQVHLWLRAELARLTEDVESYVDGGVRPRGLRAHCLTLCAAVTRHHTGEDMGAFPELARRFPELRPTIDRLTRDHTMVADLLRALTDAVADLPPNPDAETAQRLRAHVAGLTAILESHFRYEEKRVVAALNDVEVPAWKRSRPDFLKT
jgi:iron-sulfur cluster repair protein YtfE (RIC family)